MCLIEEKKIFKQQITEFNFSNVSLKPHKPQ